MKHPFLKQRTLTAVVGACAFAAAAALAAEEPAFRLSGEVGAEAAWNGKNRDSVFAGLPGAPPFEAVTAAGVLDGKAVFSRQYATLGLLDFTFRGASLLDADGATVEELSLTVNELYADVNFGDLLYLRLGKQRLKWGAGFILNPSDPVNPPKDPTAARAVREGVTALKLELISPSLSLMTFAVAHDALEETGVGARFSTSALPNTDLSLSGYWSAGESWTAALNASVAPLYAVPGWDTLQLWVEGSLHDRVRYAPWSAGTNPGAAVPGSGEGPRYSVLVGGTGQLPVARTVLLAEYYHLSEGLTSAELGAVYGALATGGGGAYAAWYGELAGRPGRQGRDYLFVSLSQPTLTASGHPVLDRIGLSAACLFSLTDRSFYASGGLQTAFVTDSSVDLTVSWAHGGADTEFGNTPAGLSAGLEVKVYF